MEFRCPTKLHLRREGDLIEVKCRSDRCGYGQGMVVLHYFTLEGVLVDTKHYKDPGRIENVDASGAPVRYAGRQDH